MNQAHKEFAGVSFNIDLIEAASELPGIKTMVRFPCPCEEGRNAQFPLEDVIIHLNDDHSETWIESLRKQYDAAIRAGNEEEAAAVSQDMPDSVWTREDIADWIDWLHDQGIINAEFKPWGKDEGHADTAG